MDSIKLEAVKAATREMLIAFAQAIRDLGQVPSGHLYAQVCGILSLDEYQAFINALKNAGCIIEVNHLLIWNKDWTPAAQQARNISIDEVI